MFFFKTNETKEIDNFFKPKNLKSRLQKTNEMIDEIILQFKKGKEKATLDFIDAIDGSIEEVILRDLSRLKFKRSKRKGIIKISTNSSYFMQELDYSLTWRNISDKKNLCWVLSELLMQKYYYSTSNKVKKMIQKYFGNEQ